MKKSVVTIGNFDGVHLGHAALIHAGRRLADRLDAGLVALTFDPHPAALLAPGREPAGIMSLQDRRDALVSIGADRVEFIKPTRELLLQEPESFIEHLVERYAMAGIVEGPDFHFGHNRRGDVNMLKAAGPHLGFEVVIVDPVDVELEDCTLVEARSTLIRWLLSHGRVVDAARCLGRPFSLASAVVKGEQRGRTIGVPTANLDLSQLSGRALPADAVYAGFATLADGRSFPAAISVGNKPTFGGQPVKTIEAHLNGFHADLYGQTLRLSFHRWIREQTRFAGLDQLKQQIDRDINQVVQWSHGLTGNAI
jgi:riboflavin kinase/FMN adenylyltransferase